MIDEDPAMERMGLVHILRRAEALAVAVTVPLSLGVERGPIPRLRLRYSIPYF